MSKELQQGLEWWATLSPEEKGRWLQCEATADEIDADLRSPDPEIRLAAGMASVGDAYAAYKEYTDNGRRWWNDATETQRAHWLKRAGSDNPADAWAAFKAEETRRIWIVQRLTGCKGEVFEYENQPGYSEQLMTREEVMTALQECERRWPKEEFRGHNVHGRPQPPKLIT